LKWIHDMFLDFITWGITVCFTICTNTSRHNNGSKYLQITASTINYRLIFQYYFNPESVNPNINSAYILLDESRSDVYSNPSKDKTENEKYKPKCNSAKTGVQKIAPLWRYYLPLCYEPKYHSRISPRKQDIILHLNSCIKRCIVRYLVQIDLWFYD
jgi:hypothetical protein